MPNCRWGGVLGQSPNFETGTIWNDDNLNIMNRMDSETVDLIYLDPPFNSKRNYKGDDDTDAEGQKFFDTWKIEETELDSLRSLEFRHPKIFSIIEMAREVHSDAMYSYLIFMAIRIIQMHRIMRPNGSLYLHCDDNSNSYLRLVLDAVFGQVRGPGAGHKGAEITWKRTTAKNNAIHNYGRITDFILHYCKGDRKTYNTTYLPYPEGYITKEYKFNDLDGRGPYSRSNLTAPKSKLWYSYQGYNPQNRGWSVNYETMVEYDKQGILYKPKKSDGTPDFSKMIRKKVYLNEGKGIPIGNNWNDINPVSGKEKTGWATQKPIKLLERIIRTSTNEGDIVFDPFCGCGTTIIAAIKLATEETKDGTRKRYNVDYIGCDIDDKLGDIMESRFRDELPKLLSKKDQWVKIERSKKPVRRESSDLAPSNNETRNILFNEAIRRQKVDITISNDDKLQCPACRRYNTIDYFEVDHIISKSRGGQHTWDNLHLLCTPCNRKKGKKAWSEFVTINSINS